MSPFSAYMGWDWVYLGMLPFWWIGVGLLIRGRRPELWLFIGPVMAIGLIVLMTFGDPRFRHPVDPLIVVVATVGMRAVTIWFYEKCLAMTPK